MRDEWERLQQPGNRLRQAMEQCGLGDQRQFHRGRPPLRNGDYTLALAAVPVGQDTLLLAGDQDLWRCSLAEGCVWRNTTNSTTCMSAGVGEYQHALAWSLANPLGIFVGNDSGIWRSTDGISETGPACASTDAAHFQNLNGAIGSLAEVMSLSQANTEPLVMMTGLGVNGTAGVKNTTVPTADWPLILGGGGGGCRNRPAERWALVCEQPARSLDPLVRASIGLHSGCVWRQLGGDKRGCRRRRGHDGGAGSLSGGPGRPVATIDRYLPGVARARQRGGVEHGAMRSARFSMAEEAAVSATGTRLSVRWRPCRLQAAK